MIKFNNLNSEKPYAIFKAKYEDALNAGQKTIQAISISSFNTILNEVDSRYVNLKFINNNEFIFFSNYNSPKARSFDLHDQIAALFFWQATNTQIRMKAKIKKTTDEYNQNYFYDRQVEKNTLAISSYQSKPIHDYSQVKEKFDKVYSSKNLKKCPKYWGGYSFTPYEIEFWEGNDFRLNKRDLYKKNKDTWSHSILEP